MSVVCVGLSEVRNVRVFVLQRILQRPVLGAEITQALGLVFDH